jgi:hypothetical protein
MHGLEASRQTSPAVKTSSGCDGTSAAVASYERQNQSRGDPFFKGAISSDWVPE